MKRSLSPLAGTLSVLVFFTLLGVTVFGVVQGQEEPREEPRAPGPHPLEGFGPEDVLPTPVIPISDVVIASIHLKEVTIYCKGESRRLTVRASEPLPAGAEIVIRPHSSPVTRPSGGLTYPAAGEAERLPVAEIASSVDVELPQSIESGERNNNISVSVWARNPDGVRLVSNAVLLDASGVRCDTGP